ncbi:MAG: low temperature requirement protein A [Anaerolineae bacterium]|nr:low temperature requirement protein A [Anaerolineae bacterium]
MKRPLIIPPLFHTGDAEEIRKATWLELFFDLVYVAAVIELGYILTDDVTPSGILNFIALFIPIWWSWVGTTFYANRFDSDDVLHRLLVFIQIFAISSLAINVYKGLTDTFVGFALSYAVVRLILVLMYYRVYRSLPRARPLVRRYMTGFGIAAGLWVLAAFLPHPVRLFVALLSIAIDFYTPLSPRSQELQRSLPPSPHHLPERFGLFTIIVLGELFLKVVRELAGQISPLSSWLTGICLFIVAISLWWLYFENIPESKIRWAGRSALVWLYTHLPLHIALTAFGVGFAKLVLVAEGELVKDAYRLLLFGAVAVGLLSIGIIERAIYDYEKREHPWMEFGLRVGGALIIAVVGLVGGNLPPLVLAAIVAGVLLVQVVGNIYFAPEEAAEGHSHAA